MPITNVAITTTQESSTSSGGTTFTGRTTVSDKVVSGVNSNATDFTKYIPGVKLTGFDLNGEALVFNRRATETHGSGLEDANDTATSIDAVNSKVIKIHLDRPVEPFSTGSGDTGWNLLEDMAPVTFTRAARGTKKETEVVENGSRLWSCTCTNFFDRVGDDVREATASIQKDIRIN